MTPAEDKHAWSYIWSISKADAAANLAEGHQYRQPRVTDSYL